MHNILYILHIIHNILCIIYNILYILHITEYIIYNIYYTEYLVFFFGGGGHFLAGSLVATLEKRPSGET